MKQWQKKPLVVCTLVVLGIWLCFGCLMTAKSFWHLMQGNGSNVEIFPEQMQWISIVEQKPDAAVPQGNWVVSSDSDPQIRWLCNGRYLEQIEMQMQSLWPTGAVVLYYRTPQQSEFTPTQIVYGQKVSENRYVFDIGGKQVEEIRIDPASEGGVIFSIEKIFASTKGFENLIPNWQQFAVMLLSVPLLVAVWKIIAEKTESKSRQSMPK